MEWIKDSINKMKSKDRIKAKKTKRNTNDSDHSGDNSIYSVSNGHENDDKKQRRWHTYMEQISTC
jgi:hypothetical protein